jgi:cell division protein FtsB
MAKTQFTPKRISPKSLLGLIAALIVAFLLLLSVVSVAEKYFGIRQHIGELTAEQAQLQEKYERIEQKNKYLATPEGTEEILREKYNVIKPGEGIVVVVSPTEPLVNQPDSSKRNWWQTIWAGLGFGKK